MERLSIYRLHVHSSRNHDLFELRGLRGSLEVFMSIKRDCPTCGTGVSYSLFACPVCGTELDDFETKRAKTRISAWVDTYYLEILKDHQINVSEIIREALKKRCRQLTHKR